MANFFSKHDKFCLIQFLSGFAVLAKAICHPHDNMNCHEKRFICYGLSAEHNNIPLQKEFTVCMNRGRPADGEDSLAESKTRSPKSSAASSTLDLEFN
jgi:hypothetical protein